MNEKMEAAMKQAGFNEEKKVDAEEFVSKYKYDILLGIGLAALSIFSFRLGWKKGYKKASRDIEEIVDYNYKATIANICPETNVLYVVERFDDKRGKTHGRYTELNKEIVDKLADKIADRIAIKEAK